MRRKLIVLFTICFTACFSMSAHAGILVEPYVGYGIGDSETDTTPDDASLEADEDLEGTTLGLRAGYSMMGLFFGAEYALSEESLTEDGNTDNVTKTSLGVFVGYEFPVMVRAWGGYYFDSELDADVNLNDKTFDGSGMKLGVGYTGFPFISVNLEYIQQTYDKGNDDFDASVDSYEIPQTTYLLSVSAPINL